MRVFLILAVVGVVVWSLVSLITSWEIGRVHALGPGLGNLTYDSNELFQPISIIQSPRGHGNVAMVDGYLMVIYSSDGGGDSGNGGIEFWDVSDPRNPVMAVRHDNADTHELREPHGFAISNGNSGQYLAAQAIDGIQFWDLSDPLDISLLSYMDLPGINQGDYTGAWWVFWQAPYVYVAGTGSGLYVVDATDPTQPVLLNQVTTGQMGGLNPGMAFAVGNLLVLMENRGSDYATMDISDPANPVLIQKVNGRSGYSHIFAAGKILTSGGDGDAAKMYVHDVTHDGIVSFVGAAGSGLDNGGYGSYQDGFFHSGFSNKYAKFDVANLAQIGTGTSGLAGRDEDFGLVLGNLVFVGNDHIQGSALVVHQTAPDTTGPEVHWVHPQDGASDVALTGRVGVSMSDAVDISSLDLSTFIVRPQGGLPLPGKYSGQMGLVNFTPDDPLQPDTTYEVLVTGIKDLAGNPGGTFTSQFSTTSLISNVTSASGQIYEVDTFATGKLVHTDASDTFTSQHPAHFSGRAYIRTAESDTGGTGPGFLTFDLSTDSSVYVLYDSSASQFPDWLTDETWTLTGDVVETSGPSATRSVFKKDFSAGTVALGGNADPPMSGASSMYSVLAISSAGTAAPRCTINPTLKVRIDTVVSFDIGSISGGDPITYSWDFGDGSPSTPPSTNPAVSHAYSAPGRYGVVMTAQNDFGAGSCAIVQIVHNALTAKPAVSSSTIVHNGVQTFNVNPDNNTVTAINEGSLTKVWEASVGSNPRTLAAAPNGDIWVVNQADATISVLSAGNGSLLNTLALPYASRPYGIAFSPNDTEAYVTLQGMGRLLKLDTFGNIVGNIDVGPKPRGVAVTGDSSRILVTRFISPANHGEVQLVDAATFNLVGTVDLAFDPGPDTESSGRGLPNYVGFIRISPDGRRAFVPSKKDNLARGLFRDGQPLTFESRVRTIVSQIDLVNSVEDLGARIDLNDRDMAQSLIFSPVGDIFFVATQGSNRIEVHDANNLSLLGGMNTGLAPQGMAFNGDASKLYVHNFMSRSVTVFDTTDLINGVNNSSSKLVEIATVSNEAISPQVLLGKQIFHDASEPRMSRDGYISCASCHSDGGSDGQVWDFTQAGEGLRNTITLAGKSGMGQGNVHWTANFDEIQDFENDIRNGFGGTGFLSDLEFIATSDPLGNPKAGLNAELDALAAYVSSLGNTPPSPYRNPDGTLTPDGEAGRQIFEASNCQSCHSGPFFTDSLRHDVGTIQTSSGLGIGQPLNGVGFETPTLRGIWNTAPYLHNGQALTLHDVLSNSAHTDTDGLTPTEVNQLVSYLLQVDLAEAGNTPPVAAAGPDRGVQVGATVVLDGSGSSDGEGNALTYSWTLAIVPAGSTAGLTRPTTSSPSFVADLAGNYEVELVVNDGTADSVPDTVSITALAGINTLLGDTFDRPDSSVVGEGWVEVEQAGATVSIAANQLFFDDSSDVANRPLVRRSFAPVSAGALQWEFDFDWARTGNEGTYRVLMQLGDSASMSDNNQNGGIGVNLIWTSINGAHQSLGYSKGGINTALAVLSGLTHISVVADPGTHTYSVAVEGVLVQGGIPFDSNVSLNTVRFLTDSLNEQNFSGWTFDNVIVSSGVAGNNTPPVAAAGPDQGVPVGANVNLDGSGSSDGDGDPLTFQWDLTTVPAGSTASMTGPTTSTPSFIADLAGIYQVQLVVNDGTADSAPDTASITATSGNTPPVADGGPDQSVPVGANVNLDGNGSSDGDGDTLNFLWNLTTVPAGSTATLTNPTTSSPSFVADLAGNYVAELVVNDGTEDSAADAVTVTATEGNTTLLSDAFDRADSSAVGEGWVEVEQTGATVSIANNRLFFDDSSDVPRRALVRRSFAPVAAGTLQWDFDFDWARTGNEGTYRVLMQLGDSALMSDNNQNGGIGVNLIWTSINGVHQSLGYSNGGAITPLGILSVLADISVVADPGLLTYSVAVDGAAVQSGIPFDSNVSLNTVRFFTDSLNERNFSGRTFDNVIVSSAE